jgi:uncharacterized protein
LDLNDSRPDIEYPCSWEYKVIGSNIDNILSAIEDAASGLTYTVKPSNISRNSKYFSIDVKVEVPNEAIRDVIYSALVKHEDIKIVF